MIISLSYATRRSSLTSLKEDMFHITNSAVLVTNKVKLAVYQNVTILSVQSGTQNSSKSLITGSKNYTAMLVSICTACSEYSLESSINFEKGELLKETMNRRRKRDREPSRIPLKRILKVLNKKNIEKRYSCLLDKVFQRVHLSLI